MRRRWERIVCAVIGHEWPLAWTPGGTYRSIDFPDILTRRYTRTCHRCGRLEGRWGRSRLDFRP